MNLGFRRGGRALQTTPGECKKTGNAHKLLAL